MAATTKEFNWRELDDGTLRYGLESLGVSATRALWVSNHRDTPEAERIVKNALKNA